MKFSYLINYFISILVICNPATAVPVLLALTTDKTLKEKRKIGLAAGFAVGVILLVVTWLGGGLLELISVRVAAFQVTGGIILLLLALSILNTNVSTQKAENQEIKKTSTGSISVVPLAIPLMAGPGAISAVIVTSELHPAVEEKACLSIVAIAISALTAVLLYFATSIAKVLGEAGLNVVAKIGALILAAIAVENIARGISGLYGC